MKGTPLLRKAPLRARRNTAPRVNRRWKCRFCPALNPSTRLRCSGCGIGRRTKRRSLARRCDALWAQLIKADGRCQAALPWGAWSFDAPPAVRCAGPIEAGHIVPRRHRSVRWDLRNGRAICRAHHRYFTDHEKAWRDFIGPEWDRLWTKAQARWDGSYERVLRELREAQKERAA